MLKKKKQQKNWLTFQLFRLFCVCRKATFNFKKKCYESAFTHYQRALAILVSRKRNPHLWDLVTWELSTGKYMFGQHMYDYFQNKLVNRTFSFIHIFLLFLLFFFFGETAFLPKYLVSETRRYLIIRKKLLSLV